MAAYLRFYTSMIVLGMLIGITTFTAFGQELPAPLPVADLGPINVRWTPDSETLVFQERVSVPPEDWDWYTYNVTMGELAQVSSGAYPAEVFVDSMLDRAVQASIQTTATLLPVSLSPTDRYAVYLMPTGATITTSSGVFPGLQPILVDLETMTYTQIDQTPLVKVPGVLWSENETSAVISMILNPYFEGKLSYISNYINDIKNVVAFELDFVHYRDMDLLVTDVFDISADGEYILLRIGSARDPYATQLYLHDGRIPANSHILLNSSRVEQLTAAAFSPYDESKIWVFGANGVFEYDVLTEEVRLLYDGVTSSTNSWLTAYFSPNGRYLAAYGPDGYNFYVIDFFNYANGPETEMAATPYSNMVGSTLSRLWLQSTTAGCPYLDNPVSTLTWTVHNPNTEIISVTWIWHNGRLTEMGEVEVPGRSPERPGEITFETPVEIGSSNDVQIWINGIHHDSRRCFVPRAG